jgi:hypothetical protein
MTKRLEIGERVMTLARAARLRGLKPELVTSRMRAGWTEEQALGLEPGPRDASREDRSRRPHRTTKVVVAMDDAAIEREWAIEGDALFQAAMLAAGYEPFVCTKHGTDYPRVIHPEFRLRSRSMWDFTHFASPR